MTDINLSDVVAEVALAVRGYRRALAFHDVAALEDLFWDGSYALRHGVSEAQGMTGGGRRLVATPVTLGHDLHDVRIVTYGRDFATVQAGLHPGHGSKTMTWRRTVAGWKIVSIQVSKTAERVAA